MTVGRAKSSAVGRAKSSAVGTVTRKGRAHEWRGGGAV